MATCTHYFYWWLLLSVLKILGKEDHLSSCIKFVISTGYTLTTGLSVHFGFFCQILDKDAALTRNLQTVATSWHLCSCKQITVQSHQLVSLGLIDARDNQSSINFIPGESCSKSHFHCQSQSCVILVNRDTDIKAVSLYWSPDTDMEFKLL